MQRPRAIASHSRHSGKFHANPTASPFFHPSTSVPLPAKLHHTYAPLLACCCCCCRQSHSRPCCLHTNPFCYLLTTYGTHPCTCPCFLASPAFSLPPAPSSNTHAKLFAAVPHSRRPHLHARPYRRPPLPYSLHFVLTADLRVEIEPCVNPTCPTMTQQNLIVIQPSWKNNHPISFGVFFSSFFSAQTLKKIRMRVCFPSSFPPPTTL